MSSFEEFTTNQNGIFKKFETAHAEMRDGTKGISVDADGTAPQAGFLVAYRFPRRVAERIKDMSMTVAGVASALEYGRSNAHATLSDLGVEKGLTIEPLENADQAETLDQLAAAVKNGLDNAGARARAERSIAYSALLSNGTTVVAPGRGNESLFEISEAVKAASAELGIREGKGLNGTWGSHATLNRFLEDVPAEDPRVGQLVDFLDSTPALGTVAPERIDVGYFHTTPDAGFVLRTIDSFPLGRE